LILNNVVNQGYRHTRGERSNNGTSRHELS
jgi:hypothetical protein